MIVARTIGTGDGRGGTGVCHFIREHGPPLLQQRLSMRAFFGGKIALRRKWHDLIAQQA
jgi:hypothetical protein